MTAKEKKVYINLAKGYLSNALQSCKELEELERATAPSVVISPEQVKADKLASIIYAGGLSMPTARVMALSFGELLGVEVKAPVAFTSSGYIENNKFYFTTLNAYTGHTHVIGSVVIAFGSANHTLQLQQRIQKKEVRLATLVEATQWVEGLAESDLLLMGQQLWESSTMDEKLEMFSRLAQQPQQPQASISPTGVASGVPIPDGV